MWLCRKCSKPVFFAERKQSLGFDWHPNCLRCEECGKRLNPGQHAEHKGVPYCHHPCYGALFGPQLFGHGTRNECHTSFGKVENRDGQVKRSHLEGQLKLYNNFYEGKPGELKSREVNGRLVLEGVLRIYWGVRNTIHLKEEDDSRMIATRRKSYAESRVHSTFCSDSDDDDPRWRDESPNRDLNRQYSNSEKKLNLKISPEENINLNGNGTETDANSLSTALNPEANGNDNEDHLDSSASDTNGQQQANFTSLVGGSPAGESVNNNCNNNNNGITEKAERVTYRSGSTAIRRRPARRMEKSRLKRRCSINGHFYLRETSSFTPPYGSPCSIWITSKTTAEEVLNMLLEKYKVEMSAFNFALFIVKDTGELRRIREDESPLISRVMLGPHEEVAKVFIMDAQRTREISQEVAQFLNLSLVECRSILAKYEQEEMKYLQVIKQKYDSMRRFMRQKIDDDKVEIRINGS